MSLTQVQRGLIANGAVIVPNNLYTTGTATTSTVLYGNGSWRNITVNDIQATGTPSQYTYLRGDGVWALGGNTATISATTATFDTLYITGEPRLWNGSNATTSTYYWRPDVNSGTDNPLDLTTFFPGETSYTFDYQYIPPNTPAGRVALGIGAMSNGGASYAVAIGTGAGYQQNLSYSPYKNTNLGAVAIGYDSGRNQMPGAIAIGTYAAAGSYQGICSIAIGYSAGADTGWLGGVDGAYPVAQHDNSIVLNATGSALVPNVAGFFVKPVRSSINTNVLYYDSGDGEITYGTVPASPPATTQNLGSVIVGSGLNITQQGVLSSAYQSGNLDFGSFTAPVGFNLDLGHFV
jgi:hypothetical protein